MTDIATPSLPEGPFGPYTIVSRIGAGGMGEVYRAKDPRLGRDIAVKVLPQSLLNEPDGRARLVREARAAAALNHPNICTVHDVGEVNGQIYFAMELVEGSTLSDRVRAGPLAVGEVVRLGLQLADALGHAHERGLVHRDLKSANIVVSPDGRLKVLDFGLAKPVTQPADLSEAPTASMTQPGTIVGTLPYMAPEQVKGLPADTRSDVWAMGVVLQEMLTGTRPFNGTSSLEFAAAILHQPPPPLPESVPQPLRAIVSRCLEKEPARRYQRGSDLHAALEAFQTTVSGTVQATALSSGRRRLPGAAVALAIGAAIVAAVIFFVLNPGGRRSSPQGEISMPAIATLAVLPLANLSGDPEQEYFADGMTEALITDLSHIRTIQVIFRTSAMSYKNTAKLLPQIGKELSADAVLDGSVVRSGNRVRVRVQLRHTATEVVLWSMSYDRDLTDVLSLQSEIARTVVGEIRVALSPQEEKRLTTTKTIDPELYELYLKGRAENSKGTRAALETAIGYFDRAIARDSKYAEAYAGLAESYTRLSDVYLPPHEVLPKAKAAAKTAIELDPDLAAAHTSLAMAYVYSDWNWTEAEREFKTAIDLNHGDALAHDYYSLLIGYVFDRVPDALAEARLAQRLDPRSATVFTDGSFLYYVLRKYDEAIAAGLKAIDLEPTQGLAYGQIGVAYAALGKNSEARDVAERGSRVDDSPLVLANLGSVYAYIGEKDKARQVLKRLQELSRTRYVCPYEVGMTHLALDERDEAFKWFRRGFDDRSFCMPNTKVDPRFDPVRLDPRYISLVRDIGFP